VDFQGQDGGPRAELIGAAALWFKRVPFVGTLSYFRPLVGIVNCQITSSARMPNRVQRQMSADERAFLTQEIQSYKRNHIGELATDVVFMATWVTLYLSAFAAMIWTVFSWFIGPLSPQVQNAEATAIFLGAAGIWIAVAILFVWSIVADRKRVKGTVVALETDAAAGSVTEEKITVAGIKCFKEPEHHGRIYFMLFGDGRVLVRYDTASSNMDGGTKSIRTDFPIHCDLTMILFPQSGIVKYDWSGPKIRKPKAIPLTLNPKHWPEDETYCTIPWDDLDTVLSSTR
jgi:hypothetical protein